MNAPEKLKYDRATQDVGNLVHLEHFNCCIDDQRLAVLFYVVGLGATRDPYIFPGMENIWLNFGRTQVHMPSRAVPPKAERLRGTAGFVVPSLDELKKRLEHAGKEMKRVIPERTTHFDWKEKDGAIEATDPWGTRVRCHAPAPEYGPTDLGLVYVDFDVPPGTAEGIARFYTEVMEAPARAAEARAVVRVGKNQKLLFTETKAPQPEYDGHHIQVYIADFSTPYKWLKARDLINMETDEAEWRFQWIVDPRDGSKLFQIEHEVRSLKHRLFARPLVNRNHSVTNMTYMTGQDAFRGTY
ncbi:MAG TPA: glyoxalase/bleomycin resistance/dioxygenase family protein [Burkholderiales bacterium]|nr:glyoxalase/bleomycin resistance/dioxygenase family protein [Burkholderiales bacterium]